MDIEGFLDSGLVVILKPGNGERGFFVRSRSAFPTSRHNGISVMLCVESGDSDTYLFL